MIAIPAIDLKDGQVVRLLHGNFKEESVYSEKPEEVARRFESSGAARIHVVDLDGALKGEASNLRSVERILASVKTPVEVGGGVRSIENAARYFDMGASYVILGTKACLDRGFLKEALGEFGEKLIVGLDARDGRIATDGWTKISETRATDLAQDVARLGGKTVIYTDIARDGALKGPNLKEITALAEAAALDVIASGGVSSLDDLRALKKMNATNVSGVVIGKALYEKKFTLEEAIRCLQNA